MVDNLSTLLSFAGRKKAARGSMRTTANACAQTPASCRPLPVLPPGPGPGGATLNTLHVPASTQCVERQLTHACHVPPSLALTLALPYCRREGRCCEQHSAAAKAAACWHALQDPCRTARLLCNAVAEGHLSGSSDRRDVLTDSHSVLTDSHSRPPLHSLGSTPSVSLLPPLSLASTVHPQPRPRSYTSSHRSRFVDT